MNKQRLAQILTIVILAAVLGVTLARKNGWRLPVAAQSADVQPEDSVYAMLDAARKGDVKKYLAYYSGPMQTSLRQSISESSDNAFRQYLLDTNASLKGVAAMPPEKLSEREVKIRVEYVYQDRNEAQIMYLEKAGAGWTITRVETAQRVKTPVPYGTPVR